MIDTHVHLMHKDYESVPGGVAGVLERAAAAGITHCVVPSLDPLTSKQVIRLGQKFPQIIPAIGLHPLSADEVLAPFESLVALPEVKAVGEIGFDAKAGPIADQVDRVRFFLDLAAKYNKPAIIHIRDMWDEAFAVLQDYPQVSMVIHCFTGGEKEAGRCRELGLYISVTALIARPLMEETRAVIKEWPLERLMLETDGPWLSFPGDSWPNEPATVARIAQYVADLRGEPLSIIADQATLAAQRFFKL
jgi:TatD DNase family protein